MQLNFVFQKINTVIPQLTHANTHTDTDLHTQMHTKTLQPHYSLKWKKKIFIRNAEVLLSALSVLRIALVWLMYLAVHSVHNPTLFRWDDLWVRMFVCVCVCVCGGVCVCVVCVVCLWVCV